MDTLTNGAHPSGNPPLHIQAAPDHREASNIRDMKSDTPLWRQAHTGARVFFITPWLASEHRFIQERIPICPQGRNKGRGPRLEP